MVSSTVLSLTWESPYQGKTVFILNQGPVYEKPVIADIIIQNYPLSVVNIMPGKNLAIQVSQGIGWNDIDLECLRYLFDK